MTNATMQYDKINPLYLVGDLPMDVAIAWDAAVCNARDTLGMKAENDETDAFKEFVVGCVDQTSGFIESDDVREFFESFGIVG
jgi:hypothetical protein